MNTYNGMSAAELSGAMWRKSSISNSQGACVELAEVGTDEFAVRNSRNPNGPALIYTRAEIAAIFEGARLGECEDVLVGVAFRPGAGPEGPLGDYSPGAPSGAPPAAGPSGQPSRCHCDGTVSLMPAAAGTPAAAPPNGAAAGDC